MNQSHKHKIKSIIRLFDDNRLLRREVPLWSQYNTSKKINSGTQNTNKIRNILREIVTFA